MYKNTKHQISNVSTETKKQEIAVLGIKIKKKAKAIACIISQMCGVKKIRMKKKLGPTMKIGVGGKYRDYFVM